MKSGATDPFAQEDTEADENTDDTDSASESSGEEQPSSASNFPPEESENSTQSSGNTGQIDRSDLPYTLRRNNVKDERDSVHQLFVREGTDQQAREAERELEDRLGDVYRLDAREAIYLAGMQNLDDAEAVLREWGVDI